MRDVGGSAWNGMVEMERTGWTGARIMKGQTTGLADALNVVCEGEGMTKKMTEGLACLIFAFGTNPQMKEATADKSTERF